MLKIVKTFVEMNRTEEERFAEALSVQRAIREAVLAISNVETLTRHVATFRAELSRPPYTPDKLEQLRVALGEERS